MIGADARVCSITRVRLRDRQEAYGIRVGIYSSLKLVAIYFEFAGISHAKA